MAAVSYDAITRNRSGDMGSAEVPFRHFCNFVKKKLIQSALDELARGGVDGVPADGSPHATTAASAGNASAQKMVPFCGVRVLDMASGRGGDLGKWLFMQSSPRATRPSPVGASTSHACDHSTARPMRACEYDCFDISPESINEAKRRYDHFVQPPTAPPPASLSSLSWASQRKQQRPQPHRGSAPKTSLPQSPAIVCHSHFSVANCFDAAFLQQMLEDRSNHGRYHIVTIQFALHYACRDESSVALLMRVIAHLLAPGGVFIATTVDPFSLSARIRAGQWANSLFKIDLVHPPPQWQPAYSSRADDTGDSDAADHDGVRAQDNEPDVLLATGTAYHFTLNGFVDCDEYVVPLSFLRTCAAEGGLHESAAVSRPFEDFLNEYTSEWRMNKGNTLSAEEHELVTLYRSLCFIKQTS